MIRSLILNIEVSSDLLKKYIKYYSILYRTPSKDGSVERPTERHAKSFKFDTSYTEGSNLKLSSMKYRSYVRLIIIYNHFAVPSRVR